MRESTGTRDRSGGTGKIRADVVGLLLGMAAATVALRLPGAYWWANPSAIFVMMAVGYVFLRGPRQITSTQVCAVDYLMVAFASLSLATDVIDSLTLRVQMPVSAMADTVVITAAYFVARVSIRTEDGLRRLLLWMMVPGVAVALLAVAQIVDPDGIGMLVAEHTVSGGLNTRIENGWDIRATSTIGHWTALGGYLVCQVAINCALLILAASRGSRYQPVYLLTLVVFIMGAFATLTFAPIIVCLVVAAAAMFIVRKSLNLSTLIMCAPALALLAFLLPQILQRTEKQLGSGERLTSAFPWLPESVAFRAEIWTNETVPAALHRPWTGWGSNVYGRLNTGTVPSELLWGSPESEWFRTLVSGGILLLACQIALLVGAVYWLSRGSAATNGWTTPILWAFIGIVIISFVHSHFANRGVPLALWPMVGGAIAVCIASHQATIRERTSRRSSYRPTTIDVATREI